MVEEKSGEHTITDHADPRQRAAIKQEIHESVEVLKKQKLIGELVLPNDELNVYYLTAEGSLAADDDY